MHLSRIGIGPVDFILFLIFLFFCYREQLQSVFDVVKVVDVLDSKDETNLALLKRPELGITFTKLHCWRLTEFEKCVFLDADTLVSFSEKEKLQKSRIK